MKKNFALLGCLVVFSCSFNQKKDVYRDIASSDSTALQCKTEKVEFHISTILSTKGSKLADDLHAEQVVGELPITRRILQGHISVYKICENDRQLQLKELTIPAAARVELKGANLRGGNMGAIPYNRSFTLFNTKGKKLESVIGQPFYGGKIALTAGIAITANPNISILRNSAGLFITDTEKWLNFGPAFVAGMNVTWVKLQIFAEFEKVKVEDKDLLDKTL